MRFTAFLLAAFLASPAMAQVRVATFDVDASPPIGSPMAYDPTKAVTDPLSCRGIVILGADKPIVLCSVDWLGIANESHREFCERLAKAAGTTADRVSVHTIHQHDAPRCDFSAKELLDEVGLGDTAYDEGFCRSVFLAAAKAVEQAIPNAQPVTHMGLGEADVKEVASNRLILGYDGKVKVTRYTACRDPEIRAEPVGTIDPKLKMISFWNKDKPVAVLTYYATHPQSYYRTGEANPDFPGMARNARQNEVGVPHIHFNGAGGNIGAGKWNDGSKENRQVLADKVALGMKQAWEATQSTNLIPITADDIGWRTEEVQLPPGEHLVEKSLLSQLKDAELSQSDRLTAAKHLAWLRRTESKQPVTLSCLSIDKARVLHMPGELFVEYQLAAQKLVWAKFVAMAAYGEYGPGYIGTEVAYSQGGYETSERASRVSGKVEAVLLQAMETLLQSPPQQVKIHGELYDESDDADLESIPGVLIQVFLSRDQLSPPKEIARTQTDKEGKYELRFRVPEGTNLIRGEYGTIKVFATHPGYATCVLYAAVFSDPTYFDRLHAWKETGMYRTNRTLRGAVKDPDGNPLAGAVVHFEQNPEWVIRGINSATTDTEGQFAIANLHSHLTPDEERERAAKRPTTVMVTHPKFGSQRIAVSLSETREHQLKKPSRLSGSVFDTVQQQPVANQMLWILSSTRYHRYARTDAAGKYSILLGGADEYEVFARHPMRTHKRLVRTLKAGQTGTLLPLKLQPSAEKN